MDVHADDDESRATPRRLSRATALLRLYPSAWRARYQEEVEAVLEQHAITLATLVDLLWGALDARLDPAFTHERMFRPMNRLRTSAVALLLAFAAFTLGYGAFQRLADPVAPFNDASRLYPELGVAYHLFTWATLLGLLTLAAGGLPIALDIALRAWRTRNRRTLAFLALPPISFAVAAGFLYAANTWLLTFHRDGYVIGTPGDLATLIVAGVLLFGAGAASTLVVAWTVARSQISLGVLRFARWPALALTLCMATATGALVYWSVRSFNVARWLYNGYASACAAGCPGPADTNQIAASSLIIVIGWLLLALTVAIVFLARSFTHPRDAEGAGEPATPQPAPTPA